VISERRTPAVALMSAGKRLPISRGWIVRGCDVATTMM
jgi:hypothetical protein